VRLFGAGADNITLAVLLAVAALGFAQLLWPWRLSLPAQGHPQTAGPQAQPGALRATAQSARSAAPGAMRAGTPAAGSPPPPLAARPDPPPPACGCCSPPPC